MENSRYTTKEAVTSLCEKLNLPNPHRYSQDWEDEVMDSERIEEFISYYQNQITDEDEKFTLMIIIINSCDDALRNGVLDKECWRKVSESLIKDREIHAETIEYWCAEDVEDEEDCFVITPLVRKVKENILEV